MDLSAEFYQCPECLHILTRLRIQSWRLPPEEVWCPNCAGERVSNFVPSGLPETSVNQDDSTQTKDEWLEDFVEFLSPKTLASMLEDYVTSFREDPSGAADREIYTIVNELIVKVGIHNIDKWISDDIKKYPVVAEKIQASWDYQDTAF